MVFDTYHIILSAGEFFPDICCPSFYERFFLNIENTKEYWEY